MSGSASLRSIRGFHAAWNSCFDVLMCLCVACRQATSTPEAWPMGLPNSHRKTMPCISSFNTKVQKHVHHFHPCRSLAILGRFTSCFSKFCCPWHKKTCPKFQECMFFCETDSTVRVNSETQLWHSSELVDCIDWNGSANKVRIWAFRYWALWQLEGLLHTLWFMPKWLFTKKNIACCCKHNRSFQMQSLKPFPVRWTENPKTRECHPQQNTSVHFQFVWKTQTLRAELFGRPRCSRHRMKWHWIHTRKMPEPAHELNIFWELGQKQTRHPELVEMPLLNHPAWQQSHTANTTAWQVWHVKIKFGQTWFHNYWCNLLVEKNRWQFEFE